MTGKSATITEPTLDVRELVISNQSFGPAEIKQLCKTISQDYSQLGVLRDAAGELQQATRTPAQSVRLGVTQYLLGRFAEAKDTLSHADGSALSLYYLAKSCFQLEQYPEAIEYYQAAQNAGYDRDECNIGMAEVHRYAGRLQESM
ncbi:MAG: CDC27 family protein, partial [Aureliella sp.]